MIELQPRSISIQVGLLGGSEAAIGLQYELDQRGDPEISEAELATWVRISWLPVIAIAIDDDPVALDNAMVTASYTGPPEQVFVALPLILTADVPIPLDGEEHEITIRTDYAAAHSGYQLELATGPGARALRVRNDDANIAVRYQTDPGIASGPAIPVDLAPISAHVSPSELDTITGNWVWGAVGALFGTAVIWLVLSRRRDQAAARSATTVRQTHASRKKPVAVRTIDAPDE